MSAETLALLKSQLDHMEYYNNMSPFPVYDTGDLQLLKDMIKEIENSPMDYDSLPVVACKNCKSLHIEIDEDNNDICMRCNSINELVEFDTIYDYKKEKNIWNEE